MLRTLPEIAARLDSFRERLAAKLWPRPEIGPISEGAWAAHIEAGSVFRCDDLNWLVSRAELSDECPDYLNPPAEVQARFVGSSFRSAYLEGATFLDRMLRTLARHDFPLDYHGLRFLDFGCGWGRMLRILSRSEAFQETHLFGCDAMKVALHLCRRSVPNAHFAPAAIRPPSIYRDGLFDLVYAYSVFSHLSESANLAWGAEFARIVRPGGFVCVTTQGRKFIGVCEEYRNGSREVVSKWHANLANAFAAPDALLRYDSGELLFHPSGGGDELASDFYGEAAVPREFFERRWGQLGFSLLEWFVPDNPMAQSIAFLRRD